MRLPPLAWARGGVCLRLRPLIPLSALAVLFLYLFIACLYLHLYLLVLFLLSYAVPFSVVLLCGWSPLLHAPLVLGEEAPFIILGD